jgi:hypothetical protein
MAPTIPPLIRPLLFLLGVTAQVYNPVPPPPPPPQPQYNPQPSPYIPNVPPINNGNRPPYNRNLEDQRNLEAIAVMTPLQGYPGVSGTVVMSERFDGVALSLTATFSGLPPNSVHGLHVHEFGDLSDRLNGTSLFGHFNPNNVPHGCPGINGGPQLIHAGDLVSTY